MSVPAPTGTAPRRRIPVLALTLALGLLTACGAEEPATDAAATSSAEATTPSGGGSATSSAPSSPEDSGTQSITVTGVDFDFELDSTELAAGEYEIEFVNDGGASHNVIVEQDGEDVAGSDTIPPGETSTFTVTLEPGEYVFYCSVGNHRGMGMELTVTVV